VLWAWLSRLWPGWQDALEFAQPRTVLAWRKKLFRDYWRRLSQHGQPGRPTIQGALMNLGHRIDKITVRNILRRHHIEPAPQHRQAGMGWVQFLKLHWEVLAATDFFTVAVAPGMAW
jgi:hypothetical protein